MGIIFDAMPLSIGFFVFGIARTTDFLRKYRMELHDIRQPISMFRLHQSESSIKL